MIGMSTRVGLNSFGFSSLFEKVKSPSMRSDLFSLVMLFSTEMVFLRG